MRLARPSAALPRPAIARPIVSRPTPAAAPTRVALPPLFAAASGTAKIIVTGRHVELTDALKEYTNDKVSKAVANFESAVREIDVRLSVAGGDAGKGARAQRAEVTIYTHRHGVVRVEDVETSAYAAVDVVCDKVRGKLRRVKEKAIARGRWPGGGGPRGERVAESVEFSTDDESGDEWTGGAGAALPVEDETVVREKAFTAERMTASAAIEAAVQLGHDFYVYADDAAGGLRVVYKRRGGGYGVLVPTAAARE